MFVLCIAKHFKGEPEWVYSCSCNQSQAGLIESLPPDITTTCIEFEQQLIYCLHVKVAKAALDEVDAAVHDIHPQKEFTGEQMRTIFCLVC